MSVLPPSSVRPQTAPLYIDPRVVVGEKRQAMNRQVLKECAEDLEDFMGRSMQEIAEEWWANKEAVHRLEEHLLQTATDPRPITEFYATTDYYLYESTYWEAQADKQQEFRKLWLACRRLGLTRLLDFGGGTGGATRYFHKRGIACDYLDVPGRTFDFARRRIEKHNIPVRIFSALDPKAPPQGVYDGVMAYDVLEHLFDVPAALRQIAGLLRSGGIFFVKSTFMGGGAHLSKNDIYEELPNLNRTAAECGFRFLGQLKTDRMSRLLSRLGLRYATLGVRIALRKKTGGNILVYRKGS